VVTFFWEKHTIHLEVFCFEHSGRFIVSSQTALLSYGYAGKCLDAVQNIFVLINKKGVFNSLRHFASKVSLLFAFFKNYCI